MKIKSFISILFVSLIFQYCAPIVYPHRDNMKSLRDRAKTLDGVYVNLSTQNNGENISMWAVLTKKYQDPIFTSKYDFLNSTIKLTSHGSKRILAELIVADTIKEKLVLKGRVTDDYFSLRKKIRFYGLPFIYFAWFDYKLQLGLDSNNQLHIDGNNGRLGWILIIAAGNKEDYNFTYKKL
jgi:hypothetical protein